MLKQAAQAWAFASILLLPNYVDLTSSTGDARMRVPVPLTSVALAHIIDIVIVAALFFAAMAALRRLRAWSVVRWILFAALPILLLARNVPLISFDVPGSAVLALAVLWAGALLVVTLRYPLFAARLRRFGGTFLAGFSIFALVVTGQLVGAALWSPGPQSFSAPIVAAGPTRPRLVWIIFDELAYQPVFESRDPSLQLPNFATGGSYLDSLDFTDHLLGQVLDRLEGQPRWASTTLIVEGDHSWRTWMWRSIPGWSAEDERISHGGQFDPRLLLLIHTPGQHNSRSIDTPTSLMTVHDTVAAMIETIAQSSLQHP